VYDQIRGWKGTDFSSKISNILEEGQGIGDKEKGRKGEREKGRRGDRETGRPGDRETGRLQCSEQGFYHPCNRF